MRILFLHKWLVMGGIERVLINYLTLLHNEPSLKIDLLIDFDTKDNVFEKDIPSNINLLYLFDKKYTEKKAELYSVRKKNVINYLKYKIFNKKEKNIRKNKITSLLNKYDLIVNFSNHFDPYISFSKINRPIVRWQHSAIQIEYGNKQLLYLRKYDKVISICSDMTKQLLSLEGFRDNQFSVIYNPINTKKIIQLSHSKIPIQDSNYLIQVARLDKIKRHYDLINIYSELVKRGIKNNLYIIGDGPEFFNLQEQIKRLNLESRCFLLGEIENPYPYMKNALLFLHTSEREGLPTVLLESLILNVPVVSKDCPTGPREILDDGRCGALIPLHDNQLFIEETLNILENMDKIEELKKNIHMHLEKFSELTIKEKLFEIFNELVREEK